MCLHLLAACTDSIIDTLLDPGTDAFAVSGLCWLDQPGLPTELCTLMTFCPSDSTALHAGLCDAPEL